MNEPEKLILKGIQLLLTDEDGSITGDKRIDLYAEIEDMVAPINPKPTLPERTHDALVSNSEDSQQIKKLGKANG